MKMTTFAQSIVSLEMGSRGRCVSTPTSTPRAGISPTCPQHAFLPKMLYIEGFSQPLAMNLSRLDTWLWKTIFLFSTVLYPLFNDKFLKGKNKGRRRKYLLNKTKSLSVKDYLIHACYPHLRKLNSVTWTKAQQMSKNDGGMQGDSTHLILWCFSKLVSLFQGKRRLGICFILYKEYIHSIAVNVSTMRGPSLSPGALNLAFLMVC